MPFMSWNDRLSVGVEVIDSDHKKLLAMANRLYDAIVAGNSKEMLGDLFKELAEYTHTHFRREEAFFERTGYPSAAEHIREHQKLQKWVETTRTQFEKGLLPGPSLEVMNYLKNWLFDHIAGSDRQYGPFLNDKGIR